LATLFRPAFKKKPQVRLVKARIKAAVLANGGVLRGYFSDAINSQAEKSSK